MRAPRPRVWEDAPPTSTHAARRLRPQLRRVRRLGSASAPALRAHAVTTPQWTCTGRAPATLQALVLHGAAALAWSVGDYDGATALANRCVDIARATGARS